MTHTDRLLNDIRSSIRAEKPINALIAFSELDTALRRGAEHPREWTSRTDLLGGTVRFMDKGGQLPWMTPSKWPDVEHRAFRRDLLLSGVKEYTDALEADDLIETVDGLLDVIVVAWGTLVELVGVTAAKDAAAEVVRSNLSKVDGSLGPIQFREDGKILKPEGWTPPDIAGAIGVAK